MVQLFETLNAIIWGIPVLLLILLIGIYLTVRSKFAQIKQLPIAVRSFYRSFKSTKHSENDTGGYRALCTALAATVGTGNIAGVAGAIAIGGPGTIFWMWICAVLGMITKYAEVTLALKHRYLNSSGEYVGGPMYVIQSAMHPKFRVLAYVYAFFGVIAAFGIGNATQVNTVIDGIKDIAAVVNHDLCFTDMAIIGGILIILISYAFQHGGAGVGYWAEKLVPFASLVYILLCIGALTVCHSQIPHALQIIIKGAFLPQSVTCGIIGSAFLTLRVGASRGVFTNEAGMGTASIAHASAKVKDPLEQGRMGMIEVFLDTILICTLTALVVLCSGVKIPYGTDPGVTLTLDAFSAVYGDWCRFLITILVCIFAFATMLGWGLYGMRCAQYLFGDKFWRVYVHLQSTAIILGVILNTSVVWLLAEIVNGLMAIPNLIMLFICSPEFLRLLNPSQKRKRTV